MNVLASIKFLFDPGKNSLFITILRNPQGQKCSTHGGQNVPHSTGCLCSLPELITWVNNAALDSRCLDSSLLFICLLTPFSVHLQFTKQDPSQVLGSHTFLWHEMAFILINNPPPHIHTYRHTRKYTESLKLIFSPVTWLQGFYSQAPEKLRLMLSTFKSLFQHTMIILFQFDSLFPESHIDKLSRNMAVYTLSVTMHKQETK